MIPHDNKINGIFLLNKPMGISSNDALQIVKRHFNAQKAGHGGTLDPLASGLLIILLGEATKFANFFLNQHKTYEVTAYLGVTTTTGDAEGDVIEKRNVPLFTQSKIESVLNRFCGESYQTPPIYSALKHQGKPYYALARKNASIEIPIQTEKRFIHIEYIKLLSLQENLITFKVKCSKGTYIRSLVEDIGKILGCGAYTIELKRLASGKFKLKDAYSLFELKETQDPLTLLLSLDKLVPQEEKTFVSNAAAYYLFKGQSIIYPWELPKSQTILYLYLNDGPFLGIGKVLPNGRITPIRLVDRTCFLE